MAKTETLINELTINYLTKEQYEEAVLNGEINENEIYMTPSSGDGGGSSLPEVTTNDNGKVLMVVDGTWTIGNIDINSILPNGEELMY